MQFKIFKTWNQDLNKQRVNLRDWWKNLKTHVLSLKVTETSRDSMRKYKESLKKQISLFKIIDKLRNQK